MANRDGQLHDTQVLLLVKQAKIESGLILSSHLNPPRWRTRPVLVVLDTNSCSQTTSELWLFLPVTAKLCVCLMFWSCV